MMGMMYWMLKMMKDCSTNYSNYNVVKTKRKNHMNTANLKAKRIETPATQVRIAIAGRASYFNGLKPVSDDQDKPDDLRYKTSILIPKDAPRELLVVLTQAVKDAVALGIKKKWNGTKPANLQLPINNGDEKAQEDAEKYGAYAGCHYFTAKRLPDYGPPRMRAHRKDVTEPGIIESGDWCLFDITLYPFANKKKGVAVALNAVTLIQEGERFGGGPSSQSIDSEAESLYADVMGVSTEADDLMGMGLGDDSGGLESMLDDSDLADIL